MEVDFLITGQGLAGTILALELLSRGKKTLVMASASQPCASKIAAGLYNPVTGNRLVKTWKADSLFETLEPYYRSLENLLETGFLHPIGIYRPFTSTDEQNDWMAKSADPGFEPFISKVNVQPHASNLIHDPFGGVDLQNAGFIDSNVFLAAAKKYLESKGCFIEEMFHEDTLSIEKDHIGYGQIEAKRWVDCRGVGSLNGSLFSWLPLQPLKGEILEVETNLEPSTVFNRGCFMLPGKAGKWKVGSTYNWREPDYLPTDAGKDEILQKLNHLYKGDVEVVGHLVGVRPSTKDRRPLLGRHPEHENVLIFNGMGTKGVSLSPFFARLMADHLISRRPLGKEVSTERYFSLYFERNVG